MTNSMTAEDALPLPDEARELAGLVSQVAWFNRLRLLVAASVVWLTALAAHALDIVAVPWPLYALAALLVGVDLAYIQLFPRLQRGTAHAVRRHVYLQIAVDLFLILTGSAALLTGGITNPLALLLHCSTRSSLRSYFRSRRQSWWPFAASGCS
jgi:hypothetical protein